MAAENINNAPTKTIRTAFMGGLLKTADFILKLISPAILLVFIDSARLRNRQESPSGA